MRLTRPLILASASPRRADLLTQIGLSFEISVAHTDEPAPRPGVNLRAWAENTAAQKAIALLTLSTLRKPSLILAADTAVLVSVKYDPAAPLLDGEPMRVLGKPKDRAEAEAMLRLLSGR